MRILAIILIPLLFGASVALAQQSGGVSGGATGSTGATPGTASGAIGVNGAAGSNTPTTTGTITGTANGTVPTTPGADAGGAATGAATGAAMQTERPHRLGGPVPRRPGVNGAQPSSGGTAPTMTPNSSTPQP
ncbi:MAG TPA: hypothetical protein VN723_08140 [Rhizomicrobium sp.]|nr:hypothetical protein [Rhizomicrobium sp.]